MDLRGENSAAAQPIVDAGNDIPHAGHIADRTSRLVSNSPRATVNPDHDRRRIETVRRQVEIQKQALTTNASEFNVS
jgi:hypothetical protein